MKKQLLKLRAVITTMLLLITICGINAQNISVKGTVTDAEGAVIGASVVVKGTTNGTITDFDGNFELNNVPAKGILQISFVGYQTAEIQVKGQTQFNVKLKEDAQMLQDVEVVAVGYGDVKRRDLTGSIAKADMDDLTKTPVSNVAEALGGRVAGVQVSSNDGGLGDNFNITIRGAGSLSQSTEPLYVIDGFPSEASGMSALNPNDIESIDFLKDASSTAIYGSRGANGVVIITTKKGSQGKVSVTYNGNLTISSVLNRMELMNGYDFVNLQKEIMDGVTTEVDGEILPLFDHYYLKDGLTVEDYRRLPSFDWQDEVYRTAVSHNHHVSMQGGTSDLKYSASLSYSDKQGVIIASDLKKYQGRFNLSQNFKNFKITANASYSSNVQNGANPASSGSSASNALMYSIWAYRPVSPSGSDMMEELYDEDIDMTNDYRFNPVLSARNELRRNTTNQLNANFAIEWEIIKNLKLKSSAGYIGRDYKREEFNGTKTKTGNSHPSNSQSKGINARLQTTENRSYLNENTLSYVFHKKKHNFNALLGTTFQKNSSNYLSIITEHITNESFGMAGLDKGAAPVIATSIGENTLMSYLGRFNYNYASKYYLTASMRADGSSKFAKGNRWGYFPSGSIAWAFSREKFIEEKASWLSNGKLRFSWGLTGNNRIGDFDYLSQLVTDNNLYKYPWDGNFNLGYVMNKMANDKLKWETTEQYDWGLDLGFLNGKINLTMDFYIKNTRDLLLNADVPASSGYSKAMLNIGKLRNKGFELSLETTNIKNDKFTWTSNFNIAFNSNKIVALNDGQDHMLTKVTWDNQFNNVPAYISAVGKSAGQMYGFIYEGTYKYDDFNTTVDDKGVTHYTLKEGIPYLGTKDCQPGDPKYRNLNDDNVITDADRTAIGKGQPVHTGGFTNNFTYKGWDLNVFMQWSYGNDLWNANRLQFENPAMKRNKNMFASYNNRWTPENPNSNMVRAMAPAGIAQQYSTLYIEDGSYLKLKNISLGYTFPKKMLTKTGLKSLRLYVSAENIATLTSYSGSDPEVSTRAGILNPGFDWSAYPRSFNASFGINVTL